MPDQKLVNILTVTNLNSGASIFVPHGLKVRGRGVTPSQVVCDRASAIAVTSFDTLGVTFTNIGPVLTSAEFRVEHDHSIVDAGATALTWKGLVGLGGGGNAIYGQFSNNVSQLIPVGGVMLAECSQTDAANQISVQLNGSGRPTRFTVVQPGVYEFGYSAQLRIPGGSGCEITVWARLDGADIVRSASQVELGNNNRATFPFCTYALPMNAGQYVEFAFSSSNDTPSLYAAPATGLHPAVPSIIVIGKRLGDKP